VGSAFALGVSTSGRASAAGRLRGGRQGWAAPLRWPSLANRRTSWAMHLPSAGGGKGRPRPLHPRPGTFAPWNPKGCACSGKVRRGWLWYAETIVTRFVCFGIPKACVGALLMRQAFMCRGAGGRLASPAGARSTLAYPPVDHGFSIAVFETPVGGVGRQRRDQAWLRPRAHQHPLHLIFVDQQRVDRARAADRQVVLSERQPIELDARVGEHRRRLA